MEKETVEEENMDPGDMNALEIQQEYFENLFDCDFVRYQKADYGFLLKNIAFALYGSPSSEGNVTDGDTLKGYTKGQVEAVTTVYNKILDYRKYALNNEDIVMSVLLVVCCQPKPLGALKLEPKNHWVGLHKKRSSRIVCWSTAVFRVRTCFHLDGGIGCREYVDENGRVYKNWKKYLKNNTLPKCIMVVPLNGEYKGALNEENNTLEVKLTITPSPAHSQKARVLQVADTTTTVASIGAMGVMGAALVTPVAPILIGGAAVATVATGVYSIVRSSMQLFDRKKHRQTNSMKDNEARACYLNIATSSVGMMAGASTKLLAKVASSGHNISTAGKVLEKSVEVLRYSNMIASGGGLVNSLAFMVIKYQKHGETPSSLELFQFASSTLFFTNAVMSNRTAQSIIEEAQNKTIRNYRATLKGMQRKIFDRATNVARKVQGKISGNTEIIRGIKIINDKQQYFNDIIRVGNGAKKLLLPLGKDGGVKLDTACGFTGWQTLKTVADAVTVGGGAAGVVFKTINPGELIRIGKMAYTITTAGIDYITSLLEELSERAHEKLMLLVCNLLGNIPEKVQTSVKKICPYDDIFVTVVRFVFKYIKKICRSSYREGKDVDFVDVLEDFFVDGRVKKEKIKRLFDRMKEKYERKRAYHSTKKEVLVINQIQSKVNINVI